MYISWALHQAIFSADVILKKEESNTRKLGKNSELQARLKLTNLDQKLNSWSSDLPALYNAQSYTQNGLESDKSLSTDKSNLHFA